MYVKAARAMRQTSAVGNMPHCDSGTGVREELTEGLLTARGVPFRYASGMSAETVFAPP